MSVYQATVDPAERNTSHTLMLELVGHDKTVLDVGCASGYLAEALGKNGCLVSGVEYDEGDAEKARPFLQELVVADLNEADLGELLAESSFDAIVFGDVLEHLLHPGEVLKSSLRLLRPGGAIVISIPNVAHGAVRLSLLQGRWNYSSTGLLDRTHIKFFTMETLLGMLHDAGLAVTELRSTVADPLATEIGIDGDALPPDSVEWVRNQPYAKAYQFVLTAQRASEVEPGSEPEMQPAIPETPFYDIHAEHVALRTQVAERDAHIAELDQAIRRQQDHITELRRAVLTSRDHAIGSEAMVGRMRAELDVARAATHTANLATRDAVLDAQYAHSELAKSIKDSQDAHAKIAELMHEKHRFRYAFAVMVGPRAWRLMTAPLRPVRNAWLKVKK